MHKISPVLPLLPAGLVLVLLSATSPSCRTWYIKPDGTGDAPTIQAGVDSAAVGDTVLVAAGTYHDCTHTDPGNDLNCVLAYGDIIVRSESGPAVTIIDAEGEGRGMFCWYRSSPVVDGFTITGGVSGQGGGVHMDPGGAAHLINCVITGNYAPEGGGIYVQGGEYGWVHCVEDCQVIGNSAIEGGGVYALHGDTLIRSCVIAGNTTSPSANGAVQGVPYYGFLTIEESLIVDNYCHGIHMWGPSSEWGNMLYMNQTTIANNEGYQVHLDGVIPQWARVLCVGRIYCANEYEAGHYDHVNLFESECSFGQCWDPQLPANNLDTDPFFCDPANGDYSLAEDSPCLPENNDWGVLIGALGQGCGPVALTPQTWARVKARYR